MSKIGQYYLELTEADTSGEYDVLPEIGKSIPLTNSELLSNCCGAKDIHDGNLDNNEGVCADCGEHCEMEEV